MSTQSAPEKSLFNLGYSLRKPTHLHTDMVNYLLQHKIAYRMIGSGTLGLVEIACVRAEGFHEAHLNSWDALAGLLLIQEAGGICTPFTSPDFVLYEGRVTVVNSVMSEWISLIGEMSD